MNTIVKSVLAGLALAVIAYFIAVARDKDKSSRRYKIDYTLQVRLWDSTVIKNGVSPVVEIEAILRRRLEKSGHTFSSVHRTDQTSNKEILDVSVGNIGDSALMLKLLSSEGLLQIWETYQLQDVTG